MSETNNLFDPELFGRRVKRVMGAMNLSVRKAAKEIDVSSATVGRVILGKSPDIETFLRICAWMDKNERFVELKNGPEQPCETCKGDIHFCASVPMRHCEKALRGVDA